ncbi:hypothetical protein VOM14_31105 [Paraburkholderia sp. MPAMCS5]|uniref:hypothetical protein n=1 Tax=Paraburkholderia sp. MPAMCS5 TaxID=3112563 RepID=UPI002E19B003|nr:hypothetical protein [Paraburkholderia sp. MPAMCS5]
MSAIIQTARQWEEHQDSILLSMGQCAKRSASQSHVAPFKVIGVKGFFNNLLQQALKVSDIDELMRQLEVASVQVRVRRAEVRRYRAYIALLERLAADTYVQRNELAVLEGEWDRWETLHRGVSGLLLSCMQGR